jgi:hypothetical protein
VTAGSGGAANGGAGASGAGSGGSDPSAGSGGRAQPRAGRGAAGGGGDGATFNELIDKLSDALTQEQRARIVQALATNSVTPEQLNELLDAVTNAGSCEDGHDACQQMCRLVLNACPSCMINRMTAEMEQAKCAAL